MKLQYRRYFLAFCLLCAAAFPSLAQRPQNRRTATTAAIVKADKREPYVRNWVEDYNKHGRPIITVEFLKFRTLSDDLENRLQRAFPRHRLTLADMKFRHNGTWASSYCLVENRKNGEVTGFYSSLDAYNTHSPDPFSVLLSSYRVRDNVDALSKATTLMDFLALLGNDRIQEVKKSPNEFTFLICSNTYSITDVGAVLHVPFNHRFAFGRLYFEHNEWERNKCPVLGSPGFF